MYHAQSPTAIGVPTTAPGRVWYNPEKTKVQISLVPTVAPKDATGALKELWEEAYFQHNRVPYHVQQALSAIPKEQLMFAQVGVSGKQ